MIRYFNSSLYTRGQAWSIVLDLYGEHLIGGALFKAFWKKNHTEHHWCYYLSRLVHVEGEYNGEPYELVSPIKEQDYMWMQWRGTDGGIRFGWQLRPTG